MEAGRLPANFASTGNAIENLAFQAKDALLVVDDYAPSGGRGDGELHALSERLFRSAGNGGARNRLGGNGRVIAPQPPRALLLATGEQVPAGRSIRGRLVVLTIGPSEVDLENLSECQQAAQNGLLSESMGAFLSWVAQDYEERQRCLRARTLEIRDQGRGREVHARLPGALAQLQAAWEMFLDFAFEIRAIEATEKQDLNARCERSLLVVADLQVQHHETSNPGVRFLTLLRNALACGKGHFANRLGRVPEEASTWGWQCKPGKRSVPRGPCIGWVAGNDLFLEPVASYRVAQEHAGKERLTVGEQALRQRLRTAGLLASVDEGRQMLQVRRTLAGRQRQVLHLKSKDLLRPKAPHQGS